MGTVSELPILWSHWYQINIDNVIILKLINNKKHAFQAIRHNLS